MELLLAAVMWTCKTDFDNYGNRQYVDCGYREVSTLKLSCRKQIFTDHMGVKHDHHYCKPSEDVFIVMPAHVG